MFFKNKNFIVINQHKHILTWLTMHQAIQLGEHWVFILWMGLSVSLFHSHQQITKCKFWSQRMYLWHCCMEVNENYVFTFEKYFEEVHDATVYTVNLTSSIDWMDIEPSPKLVAMTPTWLAHDNPQHHKTAVTALSLRWIHFFVVAITTP